MTILFGVQAYYELKRGICSKLDMPEIVWYVQVVPLHTIQFYIALHT